MPTTLRLDGAGRVLKISEVESEAQYDQKGENLPSSDNP
jgi:hypothetical protein